MSVNEILAELSSLNTEVNRLNTESKKSQGKVEQLTSQRDAALKKYNETYGTSLTPETVEVELNALVSAKEKEVANLKAILEKVNAKDYAGAEALIKEGKDIKVETPVATVKAEAPVAKPEVAAPVVEAPKVEAPKVEAPVAKPEVAPPPATVAKPRVKAPTSPEPALAPPPMFNAMGGLGAPKPTQTSSAPKSGITSFEEILKGTSFGV